MADCCSSSCLPQLVWYGIGRPAFEARLHRRRLQAQTCDGDRRERNVASLVIMNYSRPQMVMQLAQNYATYVCLDHILVVDCQPGRLALAASDRLTTVTITPDPGLYARFAAAALARSVKRHPVLTPGRHLELTPWFKSTSPTPCPSIVTESIPTDAFPASDSCRRGS